MIVLGVDPGTAIVGYGLIKKERNVIEVLDYGCIYTEPSLMMAKRLQIIYRGINNILSLYKPESVAIEDIFYFKNNKTVIKVGQARGVIILAAAENGIETYDYTPLQVKMGVTGYGRADKKQIQLMVKKILKLNEIPKPDDAADGLAIALTHLNSLGSGLLQYRDKSVSKKVARRKDRITYKEYQDLYK